MAQHRFSADEAPAVAQDLAAEAWYVGQTVNTDEIWRAHYGDLPPVAHLIRQPLAERWLRIHSLPESKRYAETDCEHTELLHRHNCVGAEILRHSGDAILFVHAWTDSRAFATAFEEFSWARRCGLLNATVKIVPSVVDSDEAVAYAGCIISRGSAEWEAVIRDVAEDHLSSVVFCNPTSGELYAPYDGGADIFASTPARASHLKSRWRSWLSPHPAGL